MFLPGESQGQQSLVGCRLWGHTESDTTETTWQQQLKLRALYLLTHLILINLTLLNISQYSYLISIIIVIPSLYTIKLIVSSEYGDKQLQIKL